MSKVFACIDGTDVTPVVCDYAAWAAKRTDTELQFLHVLEKSEFPDKSNLSGNIGMGAREALLDELASLDAKRSRLALEQGRIMLASAEERAATAGVKDASVLQRHGNLIETLEELEADISLLVLGKHSEHLSEHVGSRLESLIRVMHLPMLITNETFVEPQHIMIAFDGSETTRKCVEYVAQNPLFNGLPCHLVSIGGDTTATQQQQTWASEQLDKNAITVTRAIIQGEPEHVLTQYQAEHNIDLLVMGAYGHSVIRRLLVGSTTTSIIRDTAIPVLLLR